MMHWVDWMIMTLPIIVCVAIAAYTKRYARGVADFVSGGRAAGRYLICAARSEQGDGAAVFVSNFQSFLVAGFTLAWWNQLSVPAGLLLMVTGYVIYRYRETRAMTLGQFFQERYSRRFRLFAGALGLAAGLLNFGIIPAVGARFMVAFLNWPQSINLFAAYGHVITIPTYVPIMFLLLSICVLMTTVAGQVSVLITDCAQGMFSQIFYTLIAGVLLIYVFDWTATKAVLLDTKPGESLVNPFDSFGLKDFNFTYVLIGLFFLFYRTIAWQNQHAFNSSASTPHESRMGAILGRWRAFAAMVMVTLLSVCAMTFYRTHPTEINDAISQIADPATRDQMRSPIALTLMLPAGVKGMLLSICLMGIIAGDGIHLHSWGSIFIQDVVLPLRRTPMEPDQHIRFLRWSIVGVAVWAFLFGLIFPQTPYVAFWWTITEAIFVSGGGIAVIAGLYWARGTTAGAWASLITGATLALLSIGTQFYYERYLHRPFVLTLPESAFWSAIFAASSYVVVSLATCVVPHDMDRLLHRGRFATAADHRDVIVRPPRRKWSPFRLLTIGIDSEFTPADRLITIGITGWSLLWFAVFAIGSVVYFFHPWSNDLWATYWLWTSIYLPLIVGAVTTVWFTWGCSSDAVRFFRRLRSEHVDAKDDGTTDVTTFNASP